MENIRATMNEIYLTVRLMQAFFKNKKILRLAFRSVYSPVQPPVAAMAGQ
jgi:hypothetical protein